MKKNVKGRLALIIGFALLALYFLVPSMALSDGMSPGLRGLFPERGITLGLDLQGGLHLVFEVDGDRAVEITVERLAQRIQAEAADRGIETVMKSDGLTVTAEPSGIELAALIADQYSVLESTGEGTWVYDATTATATRNDAVDQALEKIRNRIDKFGVAEPTIHRQADNEIVIQLPGVKDPKRAIEFIGQTAQLEFKIVDNKSPLAAELPQAVTEAGVDELLTAFANKLSADQEILFQRGTDSVTGDPVRYPFLLQKAALISGNDLSDARVSIDQAKFNEPYVSLTFSDAGAALFDQVTGDHVGENMAIVLDGTVYSAPVIQERISGGSASISGSFTMDKARDLAIVLKIGALPAPLKMIQNVTVGPSLGRDSIQAGKLAGLIGGVLVIVFMLVYYRVSGLIADFALVLNILLLLGLMSALHFTLTLPGIAGVILAIGMAVDSNVLMFERMREELRAGKTPRAAVDSGYDKAFWTIFDSHVTTFITALVLFQFGTGPIKGFAVTLSLGVAINLFTALIGTKTVFDIINRKSEVRSLSI